MIGHPGSTSRCILFSMLAVLLTSPLMTGCWSYHELDKDAPVRAFSLDLTAQGTPLIGVEVDSFPLTPSETGAEEGNSVVPITAFATGATFQDAGRNLTKMIPNRLSYSHVVSEIFSERMMRSNQFAYNLDRATRSSQIRRRFQLFATSGDAKDILRAQLPLSAGIGVGLGRFFHGAEEQQESAMVDINELLYEISTPGIDPLLPRLILERTEATDTSKVHMSGSAVFRGEHFVGWMNGDETRGAIWLRGKTGHPVFTISRGDADFTVKTDSIHTTIGLSPSIARDEIPKFQIKVRWRGMLEMYTGSKKLGEKDVSSAQGQIADYIKSQIQHSIAKGQALRSDVFGFGNVLYRHQPQFFQTKYKGKWDTKGFPNAQFQISIHAGITGTGYTTSPAKNVR